LTEYSWLWTPKNPRHVAIIMDGNGRWPSAGVVSRPGHVAAWNRSGWRPPGRRLGISTSPVCPLRRKLAAPRLEIRVLMALMRSYLRRELRRCRITRLPSRPSGSVPVTRKGAPELAETLRHLPRLPNGPDPGPELRRTQRNRPCRAKPGSGGGAGRLKPEDIDAALFARSSTPPTCPTLTSSSAPAASTA